VPADDRLRIAVFIDFDNIEIGVKNTMNTSFDAGLVLEALRERGDVVSKTAYSDWQRAGGYSRALTQHAIKMVQRNLTPGGDKNGADINLALDALEMAFTHPHINAFVIVGGDSDFISLLEKLKQYDKKVFVVGGRQFTSAIMQRNCHEFIAYENLVSAVGVRRQPGREPRIDRLPLEHAIPLVTRGLKVLADREVTPQLGLLKSTLIQLDSTFSERTYGAGSFRDFVEKLAKLGILTVQQGKGGLLVSAVEGAPTPTSDTIVGPELLDGTSALPEVSVDGGPVPPLALGQAPSFPEPAPARATLGSTADGVHEFGRLLASTEVRRWPMYLRNVKQVLRQADASFDERAYGFGHLTDLLRAAQKDGIVRLDRDRQGVVRVFKGTAWPGPQGVVMETAGPAAMPVDMDDIGNVAVASVASDLGVPLLAVSDQADEIAEEPSIQPHEDPTAVRLGTAAPKRRRTPTRSTERVPAERATTRAPKHRPARKRG
jgi:uncharacterized LabA/DUF88 family protein